MSDEKMQAQPQMQPQMQPKMQPQTQAQNAADPLKEQKCPACGGSSRFDPVKGKLVCEYCGTVFDIPVPETKEQAGNAGRPGAAGQEEGGTKLEGFDFNSLNSMVTDPNAEALPVYNCVSCGAEVIAPAEQIALTCPYCRNNIVLTNKVSGKLRPNGIIPFRISSKELPAAVQKFYKGKVLLPRRFFSDSTMGNVTGVYVPFWIFTGRVRGDVDFNGMKTSTQRQGNYEITDTSHYILSRRVGMSFENVPVDASGKIDDALMDSLEPFELNDVKPFDMRYLAGFTADRFDVAKDTIADRAKQRMMRSAESIASANIGGGYGSVTKRGGSLHLDIDAKYLLLPVYLFDIMFNGKNYHFAVNGQSGKVVGELPTDWGVSLTYFLVRMLGVAAAILLLCIRGYLAGR